MLLKIRRLLGKLFSNSSKVNNEPLNKISLIVIIIIDIFILTNVFIGIDDIGNWYISPDLAYPCYSQWESYQKNTNLDERFNIVKLAFSSETNNQTSSQQIYQQYAEGYLGKVSPICLKYAEYKDQVKTPKNQQVIQTINLKNNQINTFEQKNQTIHSQYNSTLLEKIAGQSQEKSINQVSADKAKQALEQNNRKIFYLKQEVSHLSNELISRPESTKFLGFYQDKNQFGEIAKGYEQAKFWYPVIQLTFQSLFLVPLIFIALLVNNLSQRKNYGLVGLMSWHLLVIFLIPLIFKSLEFLQVGVIVKQIYDLVSVLLGGLIFLVSYVYILIIPIVGFGIIKFFQKIVFNPRSQVVSRVEKVRCIRCAKKLRHQDIYCPYCGYDQNVECHNCHNFTYKKLPYCNHCGHSLDMS